MLVVAAVFVAALPAESPTTTSATQQRLKQHAFLERRANTKPAVLTVCGNLTITVYSVVIIVVVVRKPINPNTFALSLQRIHLRDRLS